MVTKVNQRTTALKVEENSKKKFKLRLPNVIVMMLLMMLVACLLTYIIPAGNFEYNENGQLIPGTYHTVENTPVNPIMALTLILEGGIASSSVVITILFMGGLLGGIFQLDSINKVISALILKFENAGPKVLVLGMFLLMSFIGFFLGGDMMIVFVTLGVILTRKLRLDPITALAVTFLPLFLAFSVAPNGEAYIGQLFAGLPLYSGYIGRTIMFLIFMPITAAYVVLYARKVLKDPTKSAMGSSEWLTEDVQDSKEIEKSNQKITWQDIIVVATIIVGPIVLAYGNLVLGWAAKYNNGAVITVFMLAFILAFVVKRKSLDDMVGAFSKGLQDMVVVGIVIALARTVSVILENGNILSTVINAMTSSLGEFPLGVTSILIFIAALIFNFLVPSGSGMSGVMMPILQPVADLLGMTDQVLVTSIQFGGGLGNLIIPTLGATMGAIALARANFGAWIKFMVPLFLIWMVVGAVILFYIASVGWVG